MNYGNLVAILIPFPLLIFWFGASMLVYALNRHHPDPRVGHYTQQAAYRFYGVTGFFVAVATFIPVSYTHLDVYKRQDHGRALRQARRGAVSGKGRG